MCTEPGDDGLNDVHMESLSDAEGKFPFLMLVTAITDLAANIILNTIMFHAICNADILS